MAQETGWDLDRVNRYADPPIRERAYVAQCASEVQIHQSRGHTTLAAVVANSLGLSTDELAWDSAHANGQWLVRLNAEPDALLGVESPQWSYEPAGKSVNPLNALARKLMGLDSDRDTAVGSAVQSTIIVDTTAAQPQGRVETISKEAPTSVKLTAVPELEVEVVELDQQPERKPAVASRASTPQKKARKGRAKVPSWDEILFGGNSTDD